MAEWSNIKAIDAKLLSVTRDHFRQVYVSDQYEEKGYESLRINSKESDHVEFISSMLEIREYTYDFTLYIRRQNRNTRTLAGVRVDKLINLLSTAKKENTWIDLVVNKVDYSSDPDNEDQIVALVQATMIMENKLENMPDENS